MNATLSFFIMCIVTLASIICVVLILNYFPKNALQLVCMGIFGVIIAMFLVVILPKNCEASQKEGFEDTEKQSYIVTMCPENSSTYIDKLGNTNCCEGQINGSMCDGVTVCTFSGSAQNKYPICGNHGRRRKWFGPIDLWAKNYMETDYVMKFEQILEYMKRGLTLFDRPEIKNKFDKEIVNECKALVAEETDWFSYSKKDKSISFQEELMYIVSNVIRIAQKVKNPQQIYQQVQAEIIKKCTDI
jgi:hypothetical protein